MNKKLEQFTSYLDFLYNWLLPQAILYGMSPDQFWYDEPQLFFSYARSYEMQQERKIEYDNTLAWFSNQYTLAAIQQALTMKKNAKIYPQKPFDIGKKKDEISTQEKFEMRKMKAMAMVERYKQNK